MGRKPNNIIYGANDWPPVFVTLVLALQHIFVLSSTLIFPAILVQAIGGGFLQTNSLVAFSMIAAGIGTFLQAIRKGPIGSGYLVPNTCGPAYLSVSLHAAWLGGLPLMHGMIIVSGLFEAFFSQVIHYIRRLFPPEVVGLVVVMVGVSLIPLGASKFVGIEYVGDPINGLYVLISLLTLCTMVAINIWAGKKLKLYGVLIGMAIGYLLCLLFGFLTHNDLAHLLKSPWFALPGHGVDLFKLSFKASLIIPFIITAIVASLKTFGNISTAQKANDADWKEVDTKNIGRGLLADSIGVMLTGLLGGMATDTSSSNVGLSLSSGATSRYIAFAIGILFVFFGFSPRLTGIFAVMPAPVMGAILIFVTCFMVLSGLQIILHTQPDTKKTFIVGIAFVFGLSLQIMSGIYSFVPSWIAPIFNSSLTLSTVIAILLNFLFNISNLFDKKINGPK